MFSFLKRKPKVDYTHWDIHALARVLDPKAWEQFDSLPIDIRTGKKPYYSSFAPVQCSFAMAINALKSGVKATKHHLWNNEELIAHINNTKCKN